MKTLRTRTGVGLAALALGMSVASAAAFAQYYPSDRKLNDNGSVYEPGSALSMSTRQPARRRHLVNYAPQTRQVSQARPYWPGIRKANDNGSVDEPGPGR